MVKQFATTGQNLLKLRHHWRSQTPWKRDWYLDSEQSSYENEIHTCSGAAECSTSQDTATGKQTSLRTKDETEAKSLLNARNEAQRQPVLNLHLARAYLTASDPAFVERTWQTVMEQLQSTRQGQQPRALRQRVQIIRPLTACGTRNCWKPPPMISLPCSKTAKLSIVYFLKRLHNFALSLGWIAIPIVAPYLWPKYEAKDRRGITPDEQQSVLAMEKKPSGNCFWNCFGKPARRRATPPP